MKMLTRVVAPCILAAIASSTVELLFASYFTTAYLLPSTDPYNWETSQLTQTLSFGENLFMAISVKVVIFLHKHRLNFIGRPLRGSQIWQILVTSLTKLWIKQLRQSLRQKVRQLYWKKVK